MKIRIRIILALVLTMVMTLTLALPAAASGTVTYSGQGLNAAGTDFEEEICCVVNGAEVDGAYILWVLTATKSDEAYITITGLGTMAMTKMGNGAFQYLQTRAINLSALIGNVTATYSGEDKNPQLVISHGCCGCGCCCFP